MNSPITGKPMISRIRNEVFHYKGEKLYAEYEYWEDEDGTQYTTREQDNRNLTRVYSAYRKKHPDAITPDIEQHEDFH